jgi:hypothetical protein
MAGILGQAINVAQGLQGIAAMRSQMDQNDEDRTKQKTAFDSMKAYQDSVASGAPNNDALNTALLNSPEYAQKVQASMGLQDRVQKQDAAQYAIKSASVIDSPDEWLRLNQERTDRIVARNGNPAETIGQRKAYLEGNKGQVKNGLKGVAASLVATGDLHPEAYQSAFGKDPNSMNEYQKTTTDIDRQRLALEQQRLASGQAQDNSYYTFGQTAGGIVRQNARTGAIERATDAQGNPIIGAAADPTLQGRITEAEKTGAFNAERASDTKKALKMNDQVLQYTNTAEELLPKATGSGVGAAVDAAGRLVGVSSKSSEAAAKLKTLSGWLVSNVPRMEGPQSNRDVQNYQKMAGDVGNDRLTIEERIASLNALKQLISSQKELNTQVLNGKMQSVYDPNYQPPAQGGSKYKIEVVQ